MISPLTAWALLAVAVLGVFYFLIGYPLWLWLVNGPSRPIAKSLTWTPRVTILLAVHNGADFLRAKLDSLIRLDYPADLREILLLSDGSTDATEAIGAEFARHGVRVIALPRAGKAAAINTGLSLATAEILVFTDVRQKLDPTAVRHLVANLADPGVGAVTGELKILCGEGSSQEQQTMDLYWRYEIWVRGRHSAIDSLFNTTGCLYAMRANLARPLPTGCLGDDAVLPLNAYRAGYRIVFEPLSIAYDYATKTGGEWQRRMRTLGGMWQVLYWHPSVFFIPRRMWLHFISHKLGRLLLPWFLILTIVATLLLPSGTFRSFLLLNESLFALLALIDPLLPAQYLLKRISSPARTFIVMNLASLLSIRVLIETPPSTWTPTRIDLSR